MSSLRAVVRNSTVLLAGTAASKALVFLAYLILVRSLGAEEFGLYSLVFAYLAFFELLPDAGLDSLVVREASSRPAAAAGVLGAALRLRVLMALVAAPAAALGVRLVTDDPRAVPLVLLGALTWVSSFRRASLRSLFEVPYRMALRMEVPALLGVLSEAAHLAMLVWLIASWGLPGAVAAQGLAPLPFLALLAALSIRRLRPALDGDRRHLLAVGRQTAPLLVLLLANMVLARIDVLMLEMLRDSREVGLYAAPVRLVEVANLLPILLMTSVYPLFAAAWPGDGARIDRLFRTSLRLLNAVLVPVVLVEIVFAGPLVRLLFGADYAGSAAVLPVLAGAAVFVFTDIVLNARFVATRLERRNVQLIVAAAVTNVAANLVLIPEHGAVGAAWATLLAYAVRLGAALIPVETRPAARDALRVLFPAAVAGAAAFGVTRWLGTGPSGVGAAAIAYVVVLTALRGVPPAGAREIFHALRRERG